jgi:translation initiation factor IF-2
VLEVHKKYNSRKTLNVVVLNGTLKTDDKIVVCGFHGPITTKVRAIMAPERCNEIRATAFATITAPNKLDDAVAGTPLFVYKNELELEQAKFDVGKELKPSLRGTTNGSVSVHASTLGSLEARHGLMQKQTVCVIPCCFEILPGHKFHSCRPIIVGVEILTGQLRASNQVFTRRKDGSFFRVGVVVSIQRDHEDVPAARAGDQVAVKIKPAAENLMVGRHISKTATLYNYLM